MEKQNALQIGEKVSIEIKKFGINGEGIGYFNQMTVFIPGAIIRETVQTEIIDVKPGFAIGKISQIQNPSIFRIEPPCPFYAKCGGCQMQHVNYAEQLKHKQHLLKQSLKRYTKLNIDKLTIHKTLGMKNNYGYRNKSQMPFKNTNFGLALGLYEPGSNYFVPIDKCIVQDEYINSANLIILNLCREYNLTAFDTRNKEGLLLNLVTRYMKSTASIQITFIVTEYKEVLAKIAEKAMKLISGLKSVHYSINQPKNTAMFGKTCTKIIGEDYIETTFNKKRFKLGPEAFHQLNTAQMEVLYGEIMKAAAFKGFETVIDCFSGIGITSIEMASYVKQVYGIDYAEASIKDAKMNLELNNIKNVGFIHDRVEKALPLLIEKKGKPDVILFDPPRTGLEPAVIKTLLDAKIKKMIYVSCNPSTLAKNIDELSVLYRIEYIQPIDMFPHTAGVESITLLTLLS
jgi:23S rRNA (uracil-5-)-methyltransferase RumA